ncbi:MAG: helix-turn-helix domain-containing protein [Microlunatus sp.]
MHKGREDLATSSVSPDDFWIERHIADAMSAAHWHNHIELNLLLAGRMSYLFNGRQEQVEAGRLVLFWAAIPHRTIEVAPGASLVCIYLPLADFLAMPIDRGVRQSVMQGTFVSEVSAQPADLLIVPRWVDDWGRECGPFRQLVTEEAKLRVRRLLLDAANDDALTANKSSPAPVSMAIRRAEAITEFVNNHYAEPLNMTALAKRIGIHPSTANTTLREVFGISVNEYVIRYRLARAMQRLADTDDSISTIVYDCGFGSGSRFYDLFKERTGTTPRAFRTSFNRA